MAFGRKDKNLDNVEESQKKPKKERPSKEERAALKQQVKDLKPLRKELKEDLKLNGIKGRQDFEFFAKEVGLNYPEGTPEAKFAHFQAKVSGFSGWFRRSLTTTTIIIIILLLLASLFIIAYITEEKGHFTINVTADMLQNGFELAIDEDFSETSTRLFADEITNSNATSIYEMNRGLADTNGSNNGPGFMAYSFYIRNNGTEATSYMYTVNILSHTLGADKASWLMLYEDGRQIMYARPQDDGSPETLYGYPYEAPFGSEAYDYDSQYYEKYDEVDKRMEYGIITTPFLNDDTAVKGFVQNMEPGEVKRYTVVVWLEGDDPDCNNSILGGHCGFNIQFDKMDNKEISILKAAFKGLFRQEYEASYYVEEMNEAEFERIQQDLIRKNVMKKEDAVEYEDYKKHYEN